MKDLVILLWALAAVESNGDPNAVGDGGKALGVFQIHEDYWKDGCRILGVNWEYKKEVWNVDKSVHIVTAYLAHYGARYKRTAKQTPTLEVLARIHNGGPDGFKKAATLKYWERVKKKLKKFD